MAVPRPHGRSATTSPARKKATNEEGREIAPLPDRRAAAAMVKARTATATVWPKLVAMAVDQTMGSAMRATGAASASSPWKPAGSESTKIADAEGAAGDIAARPGVAEQPDRREHAADADEQADIECHLRTEHAGANGPVDLVHDRRRRGIRLADREHDRTADRVPVRRNHAPAQHMRPAAEAGRRTDLDGLILNLEGARAGSRSRPAAPASAIAATPVR